MVPMPKNRGKLLPAAFYRHEDVLSIGKSLLGKYLCTNLEGVYTCGMIVETEAYRAPEDKASHAYKNKRTPRTETMFQPGGIAYIYLCYGIHHLFNVVTGPPGFAHAVLIRAVEPVEGIDIMLQRRGLSTLSPRLTAGPGSMSKALGIHTGLNRTILTKDASIWIEDRENSESPLNIISGPRIGVGYAEECATWNWRYYLENNPWVSKG